jgi:RNA polymerase sigma factor (sigma-70 family)
VWRNSRPIPSASARALSDDGLVTGLRYSDSGSQAELYRRHARRIAGIIHSVLGSDQELYDLVQETFAQVLSSMRKFRGGARQFDAWLMRVAVFTARAQIRRRRVRRRLLLAEDAEGGPDVPAAVATPVQVDALRRVYRVFDLLPAAERTALALQMIDEMTLSEIAVACGVSQSTVKRRLLRGRQRFEKLALRDPVLRELLSGPRPIEL